MCLQKWDAPRSLHCKQAAKEFVLQSIWQRERRPEQRFRRQQLSCWVTGANLHAHVATLSHVNWKLATRASTCTPGGRAVARICRRRDPRAPRCARQQHQTRIVNMAGGWECYSSSLLSRREARFCWFYFVFQQIHRRKVTEKQETSVWNWYHRYQCLRFRLLRGRNLKRRHFFHFEGKKLRIFIWMMRMLRHCLLVGAKLYANIGWWRY